MTLTPEQRSLRASIAANARWAKTPDRAAAMAPAQQAARDRFEKQVDPEGKLPPALRAKLAANACQAHMQGMALKSARARQRRGATVEASGTVGSAA